MVNVIAVLVLLAILGAAGRSIYKAKKRGEKCIGCPYAGQCGAQNGGCSCNHGK